MSEIYTFTGIGDNVTQINLVNLEQTEKIEIKRVSFNQSSASTKKGKKTGKKKQKSPQPIPHPINK